MSDRKKRGHSSITVSGPPRPSGQRTKITVERTTVKGPGGGTRTRTIIRAGIQDAQSVRDAIETMKALSLARKREGELDRLHASAIKGAATKREALADEYERLKTFVATYRRQSPNATSGELARQFLGLGPQASPALRIAQRTEFAKIKKRIQNLKL